MILIRYRPDRLAPDFFLVLPGAAFLVTHVLCLLLGCSHMPCNSLKLPYDCCSFGLNSYTWMSPALPLLSHPRMSS